jgi:hypothetical protein
MHPALTYTLLVGLVLVLGTGIWAEGRKDGMRGAKLRRFALALQLGAIAGGYLVLRPGRGDDPRAALSAHRATQRPMLLDVYSNW